MKINTTKLPGVFTIEPTSFPDERGFFYECYHSDRYAEYGINMNFVQDNLSRSKKGVLRGLHYQLDHAQGKLISVIRGQIFDVAIDIRYNSQTFGESVCVILDDENHHQMYIPPGFAHGFCVLSEEADVLYKCTDYYSPSSERGIHWQDKTLNIDWPISAPSLSDKDNAYPCINEMPADELPALEVINK